MGQADKKYLPVNNQFRFSSITKHTFCGVNFVLIEQLSATNVDHRWFLDLGRNFENDTKEELKVYFHLCIKTYDLNLPLIY